MDDEKKSKPDKKGSPESPPKGAGGAKPDSQPQASGGAGEAEGKDQPGKESRPEKPEKPAKPATPVKAAEETESDEKPAAKPPKAAKPAAKKPVKRRVRVKGPTYEDLDEEDELLKALRERFGEAVEEGQSFLEQKIYTVKSEVLFDVLLFLREEPGWNFDYLIDVTALDYLGEEKRFCMVYHLYSYPKGPLIRVKSRMGADEVAPSVASIWETADWLEREIYDMFGIEFSGHPNLKRILLPDDWHGYPLRKDYDIKLQDQTWIRNHLRIRKVPG